MSVCLSDISFLKPFVQKYLFVWRFANPHKVSVALNFHTRSVADIVVVGGGSCIGVLKGCNGDLVRKATAIGVVNGYAAVSANLHTCHGRFENLIQLFLKSLSI